MFIQFGMEIFYSEAVPVIVGCNVHVDVKQCCVKMVHGTAVGRKIINKMWMAWTNTDLREQVRCRSQPDGSCVGTRLAERGLDLAPTVGRGFSWAIINSLPLKYWLH